jgi:hypothetical protein
MYAQIVFLSEVLKYLSDIVIFQTEAVHRYGTRMLFGLYTAYNGFRDNQNELTY